MSRYLLTTVVVLSGGFDLALADDAPQDKFPQFAARVYKEAEKSLHYRLLIPSEYRKGQAWPLIIWLHGSGEKGTDNLAQLPQLERTILADKAKCPAFVMAPQCPPKVAWHTLGYDKPSEISEATRLLIAAIQELQKEFQLDDRRIYLGGFSMGGCGTWDILGRFPDLFAAAFPIAGPPGDRKALAPAIKQVPLWVFHGAKDRVAPLEGTRIIVAALKEAGGNVKYTEYANGGHECLQALREPELMPWLLAQKRFAAPDYAPAQLTEDVALIIRKLPDGKRGTWTGRVEQGNNESRVSIDNTRYWLRPANDADPKVADTLAKIAKGEATGSFTITGVVELADNPWLNVEKIEIKK